jgi:hypothetical protein
MVCSSLIFLIGLRHGKQIHRTWKRLRTLRYELLNVRVNAFIDFLWILIFHFYLQVGDWIRVKATVPSPKYGWEDVTRNSIGIVHSLQDDGDVGVAFCFRSRLFLCSVADVEKAQPYLSHASGG